jgi:hypothetical protein
MLSFLAKSALVICSLAPISVGCAILFVARCNPDWWTGGTFLAAGAVAALVCVGLIRFCGKRLQKVPLPITKMKPADKESLSFLVVYLLPLAWKDSVNLPSNWLIGSYVLLILVLVIAHSNSFTFNPVLSLCWYHFYEIEDEVGGAAILVSRKVAARAKQTLNVVQLAPGVYLDLDP